MDPVSGVLLRQFGCMAATALQWKVSHGDGLLGVMRSVPLVSLSILELWRELHLRQRWTWGLLQLSMYGGIGDGGESLAPPLG